MNPKFQSFLQNKFALIFLGEKVPVDISNKDGVIIPANKKIVKRDINKMVNNYENLIVERNAVPIINIFNRIKNEANSLKNSFDK
jgi:hypothetical protein